MSRSMVGLLATVGAAMTAFETLLHGLFVWVVILAGAVATGLVACLSFVSTKKLVGWIDATNTSFEYCVNSVVHLFDMKFVVFRCGGSSRAYRGLALAVRPAGSAEVSGAQGWVLKIVSAKRLET